MTRNNTHRQIFTAGFSKSSVIHGGRSKRSGAVVSQIPRKLNTWLWSSAFIRSISESPPGPTHFDTKFHDDICHCSCGVTCLKLWGVDRILHESLIDKANKYSNKISQWRWRLRHLTRLINIGEQDGTQFRKVYLIFLISKSMQIVSAQEITDFWCHQLQYIVSKLHVPSDNQDFLLFKISSNQTVACLFPLCHLTFLWYKTES